MCSYRLTVRTLVFHAGNRGSIPRTSTNICRDGGIGRRDRLKICYPFGCVGSIPTLGTKLNGVVVESVYTADLKSAALSLAGSSPALATKFAKRRTNDYLKQRGTKVV